MVIFNRALYCPVRGPGAVSYMVIKANSLYARKARVVVKKLQLKIFYGNIMECIMRRLTAQVSKILVSALLAAMAVIAQAVASPLPVSAASGVSL